MSFVNPYLFGPPIVTCTPTDPDVIAYLTATGIPNDGTKYFAGTPYEVTGRQYWCAVDKFITNAKSGGAYSKLKSLLLNIGDSGNSFKYNAINPVNSDAAYRATYGGSNIGFDPRGIRFYGTQWLNSHFNPNDVGIENISIGYSQISTNGGSSFGVTLGYNCLKKVNPFTRESIDNFIIPDTIQTDANEYVFITTRDNTNNYSICINGGARTVYNTATFGFPGASDSIYFGAYNNIPAAGDFMQGILSVIFIAEALTHPQEQVITSCINDFNTDLKRVGGNWYAFGDSVTRGYSIPNIGIDIQLKRYTRLVSDAKGLNEINISYPGTTLIDYPPYSSPSGYSLRTHIPTKTARDKYVSYSYGLNEAIANSAGETYFTPTLFTTELDGVLSYAISKGWAYSDIVLITGYDDHGLLPTYPSYVAATIALGNSRGCKVIDLRNITYATDPGDIHPNTLGHSQIAAYVASQLV